MIMLKAFLFFPVAQPWRLIDRFQRDLIKCARRLVRLSSLMPPSYLSKHKTRSGRRCSSAWLTTSAIVSFDYNEVSCSIIQPLNLFFILRCMKIGMQLHKEGRSFIGGLLKSLRSILSRRQMVEGEESLSAHVCGWHYSPVYWPRLLGGETTPLLEIDLLFLLRKKSRNQSFGQLVNLWTGAVTQSVSVLTSKASSARAVQKVPRDTKTSPPGRRLSGQPVHLNVRQSEGDVSVRRLLVSC